MSIREPQLDRKPASSKQAVVSDSTTTDNKPFLSQAAEDIPHIQQGPISRCPDDILHEIFEALGTTLDEISPKQSVQLSSVCRRWRAVALDTPWLWRRILLDPSEPPDRREFVRTELIPRCKHIPTQVIMDPLNADTISNANACGLQDIPVISELTLKLSGPLGTPLLFDNRFMPPVGTLNYLRLLSRVLRIRYDFEGPVYDTISVIERFPPLSRLKINGLHNLKFTTDTKNLTITHLYLSHMRQIEIGVISAALPNLGYLDIRRSNLVLQGAHGDIVPFHNVKTLKLHYTTGDEWTMLSFPRLKDLEYCNRPTRPILAFISSHRTISRLRSASISHMIATVASEAPQLTDILVVPPLTDLYRHLGGDSEIKFPKLKYLRIIADRPLGRLTLTDFEALVRARFLPMQHPKSLASHPSHVIPFLILQWSKRSPETWCESELYKESSQTTERDTAEKKRVRLSWSVVV